MGLGEGHYYHWTHDVIARMRGLAGRLPRSTTLIVPERMRPFQEDTLGLLGLDAHPRVALPGDAVWEVERLHVVTPTLKTQIHTPPAVRWLRESALERYGVTEVAPTRRLSVSRRDDGHWRTTNEEEVEAVLARHGFETVTPGSICFREQVELFAEADTVVGTGAGLLNLVFAPVGVKVLQLQDPGHVVHVLWTLAAAAGADYHYLMCEPVSRSDQRIDDLRVPLDGFQRALEHVAGPVGL